MGPASPPNHIVPYLICPVYHPLSNRTLCFSNHCVHFIYIGEFRVSRPEKHLSLVWMTEKKVKSDPSVVIVDVVDNVLNCNAAVP